MKSEIIGENTSCVEILNISPHGFWLAVMGREYFLAFADFPWFKSARLHELFNVELLRERHLHWPDLDVDLSIDGIENPENYPLIYRNSEEIAP